MPDLSTTEGSDIRIIRWLVEVGQPVKRGQVILEVETDKAVQEIEALANGVLTAHLVEARDQVAVGVQIAVIAVER